jgi:hypothetical protein
MGPSSILVTERVAREPPNDPHLTLILQRWPILPLPLSRVPVGAPDLYIGNLIWEEETGFAVRSVGRHPDDPSATVRAAVYSWGDPSHRLVKARERDGADFRHQAFGRPAAGAGPFGGYAERYRPTGTAPRGSSTASGSTSAGPGIGPSLNPPAAGGPLATTIRAGIVTTAH